MVFRIGGGGPCGPRRADLGVGWGWPCGPGLVAGVGMVQKKTARISERQKLFSGSTTFLRFLSEGLEIRFFRMFWIGSLVFRKLDRWSFLDCLDWFASLDLRTIWFSKGSIGFLRIWRRF